MASKKTDVLIAKRNTRTLNDDELKSAAGGAYLSTYFSYGDFAVIVASDGTKHSVWTCHASTHS